MSAADDRVLRVARGVAIAIVPFLAVAVVLLFGFPTRTGELFAWRIDPPLTAFLLASAYLGGIRYFVAVARAREWHTVRHGVAAVVVFAGALLFATLTHLDKFSSNLSFAVWMLLYATTPFVVAGLGVAERGRDPRIPEASDVLVPLPVRVVLAATGCGALALGTWAFLVPEQAIAAWAWTLTPLTAQVTGAVLSLTGVVNLALLRDRRWSAFRVLFQAQLVSLAAIAVSLVVRGEDLRWERPMTLPFVVLIAGAAVLYGAFVVWCERRRAAASVPRATARGAR